MCCLLAGRVGPRIWAGLSAHGHGRTSGWTNGRNGPMYFDDQPGTHGVAAVVLLRKRGAWRFDYAAYITMHGIESDMMVQDRNASGQRGWWRGCVCTLCVSDGLGSLSSLYGYVLSGVTHCRERFRVTQQKLGKEILKRVFPLLLCTVVLRSLFPVYTQGSLTHVHTGIVQGLLNTAVLKLQHASCRPAGRRLPLDGPLQKYLFF